MSARSIKRSHERSEGRRRRALKRAGVAAGTVVGAAAIAAPAADAANFPVTNTNDAGANSLRAALIAANGAAGPDTITFSGAGASGEIRLTTGELPITDDVTITGPGSGALSISGDTTNDDLPTFAIIGNSGDTRIFDVTDGSPGPALQQVTISGLTLRQGVADRVVGTNYYSEDGGAIQSYATQLNLSNMVVRENVATDTGGAIAAFAGALKMNNVQVANNRAADEAGGVYWSSSGKYEPGDPVSTITNSQFTSNRAGGTNFGNFGFLVSPQAGGLYMRGRSDVSSSTISTNQAATTSAGETHGRGGGAVLTAGATISTSRINGNSAADAGGGLALRGGKLKSSTVSGNTSANGGGVYASGKYGGASTRVDNSTISGNSATGVGPYAGRGGGIYTYGADGVAVTTRESTIAANSATFAGGGIYAYQYATGDDAAVILKGSIVADNTGPGAGKDIAQHFPGGFAGGFSLVEAPGAVTITGDPAGSNVVGVDPGLDPLANNGGPTQTHELSATSAAVDSSQSFGFATDQRGSPRTVDSLAANSALSDGTDMGAFEVQSTAAPGDDDVTPPTTKIKKAPKKLKLKAGKTEAKAKIKFKGADDRAGTPTFECKVDKGKFESCSSPLKLKLDKGKHVVEVRAVDAAGNADKSPAKAKIKVKGAKKK